MSTERQKRMNAETETTETEIAAPAQVDNFLEEMSAPVEKVEISESSFNLDDLFGAFENETPEELTGEILTAKNMAPGQPYNFVWTGYTTISDKVTGEPRKAAKLVNKDKETFICAAFVLMSSLEKIEESTTASAYPCAIRLVSNGTKEGKNNSYWNLKVYKL